MPSRPLIHLKNITKTYIMGTDTIHALDGVDFQIKKNEYISIMGPSGSGKSTLMNIIGCLDTPTSGTYKFEDEIVCDVTDSGTVKMNGNDLAWIRNQKIGFVFQTFNLLPRVTAFKNVGLPLVYANIPRQQQIEMTNLALEKVGLSDRAHHKPSELSGGQRQRVAIARALVNNPSIILADEPTGNLDSETSREIMALFDDLHKLDNTIILVTHEPDIALHARRNVHILDGKIESDEVNHNVMR